MLSQTLLFDASAEEIQQAFEQNFLNMGYSLFKSIQQGNFLRKYPQTQIAWDSLVKYIFTGTPHPVLNNIFAGNISDEEVEQKVNQYLEMGKAKNIPFIWFVGNSPNSASLGDYLEKAGLMKNHQPGLAVNLTQIDENAYNARLKESKVDIIQVTSPENQNHWAQIVMDVFGMNHVQDIAADLLHARFDFMDSYLAIREGAPVGTSEVHYNAGVANLFNVGVLPEHRNHGIGSLVTLAPLIAAKRKGYEIGVLTSSPIGLSVYKSIGFHEAFTYPTYIYLPDYMQPDKTE